MSLFLDLWHACHKPKLIYSTHQNSFFHLDLGALTSHNTSRTLWHIWLSYSWVSDPNLYFSAFLSLFVFLLVWVLFSWFLWMLIVVCMHTTLYYDHFNFCCYLTVVACMKLFCMNGRRFDDSLHPHACRFVVLIGVIFNCPSVSLASLGPNSTSKEGRLCVPLHKCTFIPSDCPPGFICAILRNSDCSPIELRNAVTKPLVNSN